MSVRYLNYNSARVCIHDVFLEGECRRCQAVSSTAGRRTALDSLLSEYLQVRHDKLRSEVTAVELLEWASRRGVR